MTSALEKAAHVSLILMALVSSVVLVRDHWSPKVQQGHGGESTLVGSRLPGLGLPSGSARPSIILFVSADCKFCSRSLPFYRQLSAIHQSHPSYFNLVVLSNDSADSIGTFLRTNGVSADKVIPARSYSAALRATPTILVVDEKLMVRSEFIGLLHEDGQNEVIHALIPRAI